MKKLFYLCFSLLILSGCKKESSKPVSFDFEQKEFSQKSNINCLQGDCTEINISIPVIVNPENDVAKKINQSNLNAVSEIASFDESNVRVKSYNDIIRSFIHSYETMVSQFPDENTLWKAEVLGDISLLNDDLISFTVEYYTFSGGAHGFKSEKAFNYNPKTGEIYTAKDLIKDWDGLQKIIAKQLNPDDISIYDENNQLMYPESILFYEDSVVALYNSFDVTTFIDGPIKVEIKKEDAAPFFKVNLDLQE